MRLRGGGAAKLFRSRGVLLMTVLSVSSALAITVGGLLASSPLIVFGLAVLACQVGIAGIVVISASWKISTLTRNLSGTSSKQLGAIQTLSRGLATHRQQIELAPTTTNVSAETGGDVHVSSSQTSPNFVHPPDVAKDVSISSPRIGRSAAAVAAQEDRPEKLLKALAWTPPTSAHSKRPVLVLGTSHLQGTLDADYQVWRARGGMLSAMFKSADPSAVIVEQRAFMEGPWFGCLSASGTMMYQEVAALLNMARSNGVATYLVPAAMPHDIFTSDLKRLIDLVVGESQDVSDYGTDVKFPLIEALSAYLDASNVSSYRKIAIGAEA